MLAEAEAESASRKKSRGGRPIGAPSLLGRFGSSGDALCNSAGDALTRLVHAARSAPSAALHCGNSRAILQRDRL